MASGSEPSQQRRQGKQSTGNQGGQPLSLPRVREPKPSTQSTQSPYTTSSQPITPSPQTDAYIFDQQALDPPRSHTSVVRYDSSRNTGTQSTRAHLGPPTQIPARRTKEMPPRNAATVEKGERRRRRGNVHWLLLVGLGMLAMLVVWVAGSAVLAWGVQRYNDLQYGNPRTFQTDAVVHHNDSAAHPSHFIAVNWNRQAIVMELPGGDPTKTVSYIAPIYIEGQGGDLAPVTVEFRDVTGDHLSDMLVHIHLPSQDQVSVFVNDGTKFRAPKENDKLKAENNAPFLVA